jgi:hypothetical protein
MAKAEARKSPTYNDAAVPVADGRGGEAAPGVNHAPGAWRAVERPPSPTRFRGRVRRALTEI